MVGQSGSDLVAKFDQHPCLYQQDYSFFCFDHETGTEIEVPDFIIYDGETILLSTPKSEHVGIYLVKVCSTIRNSLMTTACKEFKITVNSMSNSNTTTAVTIEPEFMLSLHDQKVKVGDSLIYSPGVQLNTYGYMMQVGVVLGDAFRFLAFNEHLNQFVIQGGLLTREDVGRYPIEVTATFYNDTFSETYTKVFILTVWDNGLPEEPESSWFPPDPIYYPELDSAQIMRMNMTQIAEDDPDRPIPFIKDLSVEGVLIVGWDREMKTPANFTKIPPTKIAVEESLNVEKYRFYEYRGRHDSQSTNQARR